MNTKEIAAIQERLDVIKAELARVTLLFNGVTQTFEATLETLADMQKKLANDYDRETKYEAGLEDKAIPKMTSELKRLALEEPKNGWVQIADVLPREGEMVVARWQDGVVGCVYYRKSVEYPGAFCFYDSFGESVLAPKEWLDVEFEEEPSDEIADYIKS